MHPNIWLRQVQEAVERQAALAKAAATLAVSGD